MGGVIGATSAKKLEVVVLEEKDDDRIILVEQM